MDKKIRTKDLDNKIELKNKYIIKKTKIKEG